MLRCISVYTCVKLGFPFCVFMVSNGVCCAVCVCVCVTVYSSVGINLRILHYSCLCVHQCALYYIRSCRCVLDLVFMYVFVYRITCGLCMYCNIFLPVGVLVRYICSCAPILIRGRRGRPRRTRLPAAAWEPPPAE